MWPCQDLHELKALLLLEASTPITFIFKMHVHFTVCVYTLFCCKIIFVTCLVNYFDNHFHFTVSVLSFGAKMFFRFQHS